MCIEHCLLNIIHFGFSERKNDAAASQYDVDSEMETVNGELDEFFSGRTVSIWTPMQKNLEIFCTTLVSPKSGLFQCIHCRVFIR